SRQYGLTCDSLTRVRLVDAQGMLHDSQESPDLLWACRGGGNGHFGIVTRLHLQTHPAPATFYSTRFKYTKRTPTSAAMVVARWFALTPGLPADAFSACIISGTTVTVLVTSFQTSPDHKAMAEVLSTFRQGAEPAATTQRTPLTQAVKRYYGRQGPLYFKNVSAGFYRGFDDLQAIFQDIVQRIAVQPGMLLQINTFGGTSAMHPTPPPSAFPHRAYPFLGELQYYWDNSAHETAAMTAVQGIQRLLTQHGIRAHYSNYPDSALPNWAEAYYGRESYPRLQMLKKRYDPENHIQHPQSVRLPTGT
ncbi:MAG: FAD-dependent oxidoreductase, partial [Candidatus Tectomicrobia bacterium]|nr:FAD-dependent oxidoreductase [Candidatus Tectomicrobia bacterium]